MLENISKALEPIRKCKSKFKIENYSVISITGTDSSQFLSGQLTSKVADLQENFFQKSAVTDIKGRLISEFFLLKEFENKFNIIVSSKLIDETIERINLYLISEDVEIEKVDKEVYLYFNSFDYGFSGQAFNLKCNIAFENNENCPTVSNDVFKLLKFTSGETELFTHVNPGELITNTFLVETSVSFNKGCYPGQETVSKIYNNRGAAFYPVCVIGESELAIDVLRVEGKKIGDVKEVISFENKFYHYVNINRENRINDKVITIDNNDFIIKYFPLLDNDIETISEELFDEAVAYFHNENDEKAIELLKLAISIHPTYADAYESLGVIFGRQKKFEKAIEVMKSLTEVDPTSVMAHTNLSMYYMQLGDKETAEEHKATATIKQFEMYGIEAESKRNQEAALKQKEEEKIKKEGMFKQVLEIDPDDALANYGLGELELERNNFFEAIKYLSKSIKADEKYSVAYLALAKAFKRSEQFENAKETLDKGIEVATKNGDLMPANEMQSILNSL